MFFEVGKWGRLAGFTPVVFIRNLRWLVGLALALLVVVIAVRFGNRRRRFGLALVFIGVRFRFGLALVFIGVIGVRFGNWGRLLLGLALIVVIGVGFGNWRRWSRNRRLFARYVGSATVRVLRLKYGWWR